MVVPLSLDPGRRDPRSPLFEGCYSCGTPGVPDPCRECQHEQERQEALAEQWEQQAEERLLEEAKAVAGPEEDGDHE